jgi:hypothetical protein
MSSGAERDELPQPLIDYLAGGRLVIGATIDAEGRPYTMVMNSAVAVDARTIRFALDHRTHTLVNLRDRPAMSIEIVGNGFILGVRGTARVVKEQMDHAPIASALVQLDVESVKSDLPPGVQVTPASFEWGALGPYMSGVEPAMFAELRTGA